MTLLAPSELQNHHYDFVCSIGTHSPHCLNTYLLHPLFQSYAIYAEEYVIALLVRSLLIEYNLPLPSVLQNVDVGFLSSEANFSEEESETIVSHIKNAHTLFVLGRDIFLHPCAKNIFALFALLSPLQLCVYSPLYALPCSSDLNGSSELNDLRPIPSDDGIWVYDTVAPTTSLFGSNLFSTAAKLKTQTSYEFDVAHTKLCSIFIEQQNLSGVIGILKRPMPHCGYPFHKIHSFKERL